jgi:hypothetical protein
MEFWIVFWKIVFIATVAMFAGMAIWVAVKGFGDIKKLFLRIDESHEQNPA